MQKEPQSYQENLEKYLNAVYHYADQVCSYVILLSFFLGLAIAPIYSTWTYALGIGLPNTLLFGLAVHWIRNKFIARQLISLAFAIFMTQFISQMHGMAEMHFIYFIFALVLIIYQDWRMMIPYILFTVFHHSFFFTLQLYGYEGVGIYFINYTRVDYLVMSFHLGLAATMGIIASIWAYHTRLQTYRMVWGHSQQLESLENLEKGVKFAKDISNGKLDSSYELGHEGDLLGQALLQMRKNLLAAGQKDQNERFIHEGMERINKVQQKNLDNVHALCDAVIRELANYMNICQAGIFLPKEEEEATRLVLTACYAYNRKKFLKKEILVGKYAEGLLGQVYLEKAPTYLEEIPEGYLSIILGLGEMEPKSLLILPLMLHQEVVGIMELSSLSPLEEHEREFLNRVTEGLAATLKFSQISDQTRALLEASQSQAEQLRAQEEEMRQNMEELQATQEAMHQRQRELEESNKLLQEKEAQLQATQSQIEAIQRQKPVLE